MYIDIHYLFIFNNLMDLSNFNVLQSLFIGISIAAIPGPIFFELIRRTLHKGFSSGLLLVTGEFLGNFALLLIIFFGVSNLLTANLSKVILYTTGSIILFKLGFSALQLQKASVEKSYEKSISNKNSLFTGFIIAVSSPIVIALWISLSGSYLNYFHYSYLAFLNIFLIALGFLVFFIPLALLIHISRHRIPPSYIVFLSKLFGIVLIAYGIMFIYQLLKLIK